MNHVTYSLALEKNNSEEYYTDIRIFSDEVLHYADKEITPIAENFKNFLSVYDLKEEHEIEEHVLELLSFGVLWNAYARQALAVKFAPFITLVNLGVWRKKHQRLKPSIDLFRGFLTTLFLLPQKTKPINGLPTLEQVDKVSLWFEATGEFREHALRFIRWRAYWATLHPAKVEKIFKAIARFRDWFENRSLEVLGKYTTNVEDFLERSNSRYRWREDRISCSRKRVEYHLNMVGAELMNRAFRKGYLATDKTALLLPGCMRALPADKCKAIKEQKGLRCSGCTPECKVNYYRLLGEKNNYDVYIIPHASDLSLWSPEEGKPQVGVIASACMTTLVEGGLELKRYGVQAQCVPLEFSGCKKHWHTKGVETEINRHELKRILDKQNGALIN